MTKAQLLQQYKKDVQAIQENALKLGISKETTEQIFCEVLSSISKSKHAKAQKYLRFLIKLFIFLLVVTLILYVLLNVHQPTSSIVLRNVQGLIYPGLKFLRALSVPIITAYPILTGLYDESCLVENPYFHVADMECWPCNNVHSVIDLTGLKDQSPFQSGAPFIYKTDQQIVTFEVLKSLYDQNQDLFDREASRIKSSNSSITTLSQFFQLYDASQPSTTHISWRINRMVPARLIRKMFPRPSFISEWSGQSVERYLMLDNANALPYYLPNTECSYVFAIQGVGQRMMVLKPSKECSHDCRPVSVVLKPGYVLWYNWWYWRPISLPTENATESSITYVSSYC